MGDAADDAFAAGLREQAAADAMYDAGCRPCPWRHLHDEDECPVCLDLGWIDENGNPCEE